MNAEAYLRAQLADCRAQGIHRSAYRIIERLLTPTARAEMAKVYAELERLMPETRDEVLWQLVLVAAHWNPDKTASLREQVARANRMSAEIATKARELSDLLRKRAIACPDIGLPDDSHPVTLIEQAQFEDRPLFRSHLEEHLARLAVQYDAKYWPPTYAMLDALADAQDIGAWPLDATSSAAISARTHSQADFIRAILARLDELPGWLAYTPLRLPYGFRLSYEAIASFANAALNLDPPMTADSVRKQRPPPRPDSSS